MAKSIADILRKKYPTGTDVGKLFVETTVKDISCWEKNKKPKQAYTQEMLNDAYYELSPEEKRKFDYYADIHDTLIAIYDRNQAYFQQFMSGYYRIVYTLEEIGRAEDFSRRALKFRDYIKPEMKNEFLSEINGLMLLSTFTKNKERVEEIKQAWKQIHATVLDFESCVEYMAILEKLYNLSIGDIKTFFLEEIAEKLSLMNKVLDITKIVAPNVSDYFEISDFYIFKENGTLYSRNGGTALYKEWVSSKKSFSEQELNLFVKRYSAHIDSIKKDFQGEN